MTDFATPHGLAKIRPSASMRVGAGMDWFGAKRLWAGLRSRPRPARSEADWADMGTTIGLEASLAGFETEFDDTDPSAQLVSRSWEERLGGRGSV